MNAIDASPQLPPAGDFLFVYGTLQRGGEYHRILEDLEAEYIGTGKTVAKYPLLLARYPCLLDMPGKGHRVEGEVYRLDSPDEWIAVDRLEAHPTEYRRRRELVEVDERIRKAWTYFYIREDASLTSLPAVPRFSVGGD